MGAANVALRRRIASGTRPILGGTARVRRHQPVAGKRYLQFSGTARSSDPRVPTLRLRGGRRSGEPDVAAAAARYRREHPHIADDQNLTWQRAARGCVSPRPDSAFHVTKVAHSEVWVRPWPGWRRDCEGWPRWVITA